MATAPGSVPLAHWLEGTAQVRPSWSGARGGGRAVEWGAAYELRGDLVRRESGWNLDHPGSGAASGSREWEG